MCLEQGLIHAIQSYAWEVEGTSMNKHKVRLAQTTSFRVGYDPKVHQMIRNSSDPIRLFVIFVWMQAVGPSKACAFKEHLGDFQRQIMEGFESYRDGPPFTIQRICELLVDPQSYYPKFEHFELALERQLSVTTTVPCRMGNGSAAAEEKRVQSSGIQDFAAYFHEDKRS